MLGIGVGHDQVDRIAEQLGVEGVAVGQLEIDGPLLAALGGFGEQVVGLGLSLLGLLREKDVVAEEFFRGK